MNLKQQFQEWHDSPTNETIAENIIDLEKIAESFAINFYEWRDTTTIKNIDQYTNKEAMEMFKKQLE